MFSLKYTIVTLILSLPVPILSQFTAPGLCSVSRTTNLTTQSTPNPKLNDPFTFFNSKVRVETKEQWDCRREEINQLFQMFELGTLPPRPQSVVGSLNGTTLTITTSNFGKSIQFQVNIQLPTTGKAPFPVIIGVGGASIPIPDGVALINFDNNDMALQNDATSRGVGKFYELFGANATASSMTAWAWGISRVIDALEETRGVDKLRLNLDKIAVTGCSRDGKGALVAGAFEPRILLTIPQESGSGGAGCWRISDTMFAAGEVTQTAMEIVNENVWFSTEFAEYVNEVPILPFDHHMLAGLIAPRPLFVIENTAYLWLGPESTWGCMKTANKIWQALGVPDFMGVSQVGNHTHCQFPADQQDDLNAYINKFLFDMPTNTNIVKTDGTGGADAFVDSDWVDWSVPRLK